MSVSLSVVEFIKINPPNLEENEAQWLEKQVIAAQGKAVKLSAEINVILAAKLLRLLDSVCPQFAWEINKTESLLIFNHSTEDCLWPHNLIVPPSLSIRKGKKQISQIKIDLFEIWQQAKGDFSTRLNNAINMVLPQLKTVFLVNFKVSEEEKYFALLIIHSFLHKSKACRLVVGEEDLRIW